MKEGWKMVKLGEVATFVNGYAFKPSDWCEYGKPIIRIQNLTESQSHFNYYNKNDIPTKYHVKKGDILISWSATLGVYEWSMDDAWLNQHIFKVVFDKITIDKTYFKYSIEYFIDELSKKTNGATMKHIRKGDFDNTEIPLPPLEEQHRIVSILDATFEKIDKLKANAEENLKNAKALFQQVLAQELKPKEGWVEKKLGEVVESITDGDHQPPPKSNKGIPFITISSINKEQRSVEWNNTFFVPKEYFDGLKEDRKPKRGDILYTVTGSYGIPVLIDFDIDFCFQRHIAIIRPNQETAYSEFVNYWLLSKYAMLQAEDTATGAAQKTVSLKSLRNFSFDYPLETSEQHRIVQTLDTLSEKCRRLETIAQQTIRECDALKQSILRQAFSGEL